MINNNSFCYKHGTKSCEQEFLDTCSSNLSIGKCDLPLNGIGKCQSVNKCISWNSSMT